MNSAGLAFRGNSSESIRNINFDSEHSYFRSESNEGNFLGLVKLLASQNADLAEHIDKCQKVGKAGRRNQLTFLSNNFVSKSLFVIRKYLVRSIVNDIERCGGQFGLMMDGSQDISCKEQISVVIRYVNEANNIVERTVLFMNAKSTSGEALYGLLQTRLTEIGLSLHNAVGCSFDGASNMRAEYEGVISYIKRNDNSNCLYTWCFSHRFNLCMKSAIGSSPQVKKVLHWAEESAKIFRSSYIKMNVWTEVANATPHYNSHRKLKLIGTTRWSSNQDAVDSIIRDETSLYVLIKALVKICNLGNLNGASLINASDNLNAWIRYDHIVTTYVLQKVFAQVSSTTKYLQTCGLNILEGVTSLRACIQKLEVCAKSLDDYIQKAEKLVENTNLLLSQDHEIRTLECDCIIRIPPEEEKLNQILQIKIEFHEFILNLEHAINGKILEQFNQTESIYSEMLFLDPQHARRNIACDANSIRIDKLCEVNKIPKEDTTHELKQFTSEFIKYTNRSQSVSVLNENYDGLDDDESDDELTLLIENDSDLEETNASVNSDTVQLMQRRTCYCIECILKYICSNEDRMKTYGNIFKLYKFVGTLPSTQVKCERDFSGLKLTKTRLRSSLSDKSLEDLMIISVESAMFKNVALDDVIDEIIETSSRISNYMRQ